MRIILGTQGLNVMAILLGRGETTRLLHPTLRRQRLERIEDKPEGGGCRSTRTARLHRPPRPSSDDVIAAHNGVDADMRIFGDQRHHRPNHLSEARQIQVRLTLTDAGWKAARPFWARLACHRRCRLDPFTGSVVGKPAKLPQKETFCNAEIGCHHLPLLAGYQKLVGWAIRLQWDASNRLVAHFSRTAAGAILEF